ncbi:hypothetical protein ZIOFF_025329 [Zingiber officinale]|uniref:BI1-like protein n=1 Tax=Zingiber officinale TaxID=94328 RepID=A0A8J5GPC1_ZINOF|nr:hypothetical protein ZIOFF_029292 [Zingiber officinale]KAG6514953.1 hypothetical protein ZIOFF_025329 [Zingiber officinale]
MWTRPGYGKGAGDVEAAVAQPLYPMMMEPPELRWAFIRRIYSILAFQMLITVAVAAFVVSVPSVSHFFVIFHLGRISTMIYGAIAAIIFCGYIIYDTDNLIKRYSYDEYIWAAVALYLDIINLFLSLLTLFRASES